MEHTNKLPLISVIIPTYNRADYLKKSLDSLVDQGLTKEEYEVIVIHDGSSDNTKEVSKKFNNKINLRYFYQENSGISTAKNLGIMVAKAPILFFFDDDDCADKKLLREHLKTHKEFPQEEYAVLGFTSWHPTLQITTMMHYVTEIGQLLFAYKNLTDGQVLDYTYFWGGRSSCKKSLLVKYGIFNQQFRFGCEDIELGYRLSKTGLKVVYNSNAKSYMLRSLNFEEFCRRSEKQGRSQFHFSLLHQDKPIQQWTQVIFAEEKWKYIEKYFNKNSEVVKNTEDWFNKITMIKAKVNSIDKNKNIKLSPKESTEYNQWKNYLSSDQFKDQWQKNILALQSHYWWMFDSFKIKGIVEEKRSYLKGVNLNNKIISKDLKDVSSLSQLGNKANSKPVRKNILIMDLFLPVFDRASGSLRCFQILKSLISTGHKVTFVSKYEKFSEQYVPILQQLGIETYAGDVNANSINSDLIIAPDYDFEKIIKENFYETVIISFWDNAEYYLPLIRKYSPESKIIVDTVDIVFLRKIREAELRKDEYLMNEALSNKQREIEVYKNADALWVVTDKDGEVISDYVGEIPICTVPNIHPKVQYFKTYKSTSDLLFIGNFWHLPNIDAIEHFIADIYPRIQKRLPELKVYVVGDNVPEHLKAMATDKIIFTGFVQDTEPFLKLARISIAPLRFGAGMKGKVGEALSWGLPVVTTSIGAEGMNLTHDENVLIADKADQFAEEIINLYYNEEKWNKISRNAKIKVEQNWSPERVEINLKEALKRISTVNISILMVTYNALEYTKECLASLEKSTRCNYELIIVDNFSQDGTVDWLKEYSLLQENVKLILNDSNVGFPEAVNQAMCKAKGKYVCVINNDIVLTKDWLERMVEIMMSDSSVGLIGPISNSVSGLQKDENVKYNSIDEMTIYAEEVKIKNKGELLHFPRIAFLCTLIKKELIEKIGGLDERFTPGNYEDDDYCLRAQLAGYKTMIAKDIFIHHYGSKSFKAKGEDKYKYQLIKNREIFVNKWGVTPEELWLENKTINQRQIYYPINKNPFQQYFERARINIADNELSLAKESITKALENYRDDNSLIIQYEELLNIAGNVYLAVNDFAMAKEFFEKELGINPRSSSACFGLGQIFFVDKQYNASKTMFEWAVKNNPENVTAFELLKRVNLVLGLNEYDNSLMNTIASNILEEK